jgi:acyl dehydratase
MAKREFAHPNEMHKYVGQEIGVSDWVEVSQDRINQFAEATGDHQWIHVDVERAKKDMPGGKTIAHGNGINYGCNKVRFTSPVPAGSKVRARAKLIAADPMTGGGVRLTNQVTVEIEGQERPACVAETMSIVYGA